MALQAQGLESACQDMVCLRERYYIVWCVPCNDLHQRLAQPSGATAHDNRATDVSNHPHTSSTHHSAQMYTPCAPYSINGSSC